ncbi:MAG: hypothetical protein KC493_10740 [Bacteriovoracaceae bacterium]|nr:hypothetical protein [Bacteriovoracaceae bacterium]
MKPVLKLLFLFWILAASAQSFAVEGVLFIVPSYGNSDCDRTNPSVWERSVLDLLDEVRMTKDLPFDVSFSNYNTKCFEEGIERLKKRLWDKGDDLDRLHVVPLFMSSHSYEVDMQKYIFRQSNVRPLDFPEARKINFSGTIMYHPALDYRLRLSWILEKRAHQLVRLGMSQGFPVLRQKIILVMRGAVRDQDNLRWMEMGRRYLNDIAVRFPGAEVELVSLREDSDARVRAIATQALRDAVLDASFKNKKALILPLTLATGELDESVHEKMTGLQYIWNGEGLLPDAIFPSYVTGYLQTVFRNHPVL